MIKEWALIKTKAGALFFEKCYMIAFFPTSFAERLSIGTVDDFSRNMNFLFSAMALALGLEVIVMQGLGAEAFLVDTVRNLINYIAAFLSGFLCYYLLRMMGQPAFGVQYFIQFYARALGVFALMYSVLRCSVALAMLQKPIAINDSFFVKYMQANNMESFVSHIEALCTKVNSFDCQVILQANSFVVFYAIATHVVMAVMIITLARMLYRKYQVPMRLTVFSYIFSFVLVAGFVLPVVLGFLSL